MTVGDWLRARVPAPPSPLAERLAEVLGARLSDDAGRSYESLLSAAESLLAELLALECARRDRALDLLAVDALVTYAFEAASESPDTIASRASRAMSEIARLAVPPSIA